MLTEPWDAVCVYPSLPCVNVNTYVDMDVDGAFVFFVFFFKAGGWACFVRSEFSLCPAVPSLSPKEEHVFSEDLCGIDSVSGKIDDPYWQSVRASAPRGCGADTCILNWGGERRL